MFLDGVWILLVMLAVFAVALPLAHMGYNMWRQLVATADDSTEVRLSPILEGGLEGPQGLVRALGGRFVPHVERYLTREQLDALQKRIVQAGGLQGMRAAEIVVLAGFAGVAGLFWGGLFVATTRGSLWWLPVLSAGAMALPFIWLMDRVRERHQTLLADLPFHLDLLTLCVEAGLDFSAAVNKMVEKGRPGPLREEFASFLSELRVGKTRAEALEAMSQRVGLPPFSAFLSALVQSDRLGSGLGKALKIQSEQLRNDRFQRAESKAGEAPVKMLIPLVVFIFPTIWIILAAPLVFEWVWNGGAGF